MTFALEVTGTIRHYKKCNEIHGVLVYGDVGLDFQGSFLLGCPLSLIRLLHQGYEEIYSAIYDCYLIVDVQN